MSIADFSEAQIYRYVGHKFYIVYLAKYINAHTRDYAVEISNSDCWKKPERGKVKGSH
jgi:hypothetical protein